MTTASVNVLAIETIPPGTYWNMGLDDLLRAVASPLVEQYAVDALFVACPTATMAERQAGIAVLTADRLSLDCKLAVAFDNAEGSSAAALYQAVSAIQSGQFQNVMVVGAAKVTDMSEAERAGIFDHVIDFRADRMAGQSYAVQVALLAQLATARCGWDRDGFSELAASAHKRHANARGGLALSAAEIRRDIESASPLRRSEFARLLDGAYAVLLSADCSPSLMTINQVASASGTLALWDRQDPLRLASLAGALSRLPLTPEDERPLHFEIDNANVVLHWLIRRELAAFRVLPADCEDPGFSFGHENVAGGSLGGGLVFGCGAMAQLDDVLKFRSAIKTDRVLGIASACLGAQTFLFDIGLRGQS